MTAKKKKSPFPLLLELQRPRPLGVFPFTPFETGRKILEGEPLLVLEYCCNSQAAYYLVVLDQYGVFGYIIWFGWEREVLHKLFHWTGPCPTATRTPEELAEARHNERT